MNIFADDDNGIEGFSLLEANGHTSPSSEELVSIFKNVVEDASEAIVVTEAQLAPPGPRILWVNSAFTEITGYRREEVVGKTPRILQGPDTQASVLQRLRQRLEAGERFEGETVNYRKDGTAFVNHWSIAPVRNEEGKTVYWVSIQRDVTDKRRLQREVLSIQEEERRRIGRELHDAVGSELASTGMLLENIVARDVTDPALADRLRTIRRSVKDSYETLRTLSQGLSPVNLSEGSLTVALEHLASATPGARFESRGVDLERALADWDGEALGHLYRIVREAVANAEAHADTDTITILAEREGDTVALSVTDEGAGFDPSTIEKNGWGLRMMGYRADLLRADLTVESSPGAGTRVVCRMEV